jgi:hypothetical protein
MPHSTVCLVEQMSLADPTSQQHALDMPSILGVLPSGVANGTDIAGDSVENQLEILP